MAKKIDFLTIKPYDNLNILEDLKELYQLSFDDSGPYIDYYFEEKVKDFQIKCLKKDNQIISCLYLKPQQLSYHQKVTNSFLVVAASTHPQYMHQGYMRLLMTNVLNELYHQNIPIVTLHPFNDSFYRQFGFVPYSFYKIYETKKSLAYTFEKATGKDTHILYNLYQDFVKNYPIYHLRSKDYFYYRLKELQIDNDHIYIIKKNNHPCGYYITVDDIIEEYCFSDELISKKGNYIEQISDYTGQVLNMARIINPLYFLSIYPYKSTSFSMTFKITDHLIPENNKTITLTIKDNQPNITKGENPQFTITISELSSLLLIGNITNNPHPFCQLFSKQTNLSWEKY